MSTTIDSMKQDNLAPETKKPSAILSPNNPARPDWGILSDSLGLDKHEKPAEGATPDEAAAQMRKLLFRCVERNKSYEALILKCAGETISGYTKEESSTRANFGEMMSFLGSRLWNRKADGSKVDSQKGREHSSYEIISAWNPAEGGIKKYIQIAVSNILNRDLKAAAMETNDPRFISTEWLKEKGYETDSTGQMYEPSRRSDDEATDYVEQDASYDKDSERLSAEKSAKRSENPDVQPEDIEQSDGQISQTLDGGAEETNGVSEGASLVTEQRRQFDVAMVASRNAGTKTYILASPENPDFRVLSAALIDDVPEPELDKEGRDAQLRAMAQKAFEMHCSDMTDYADTREALEDWKPSEVSFARFFPDAAQQIGESLNLADRQQVQSQNQQQLEFELEFLMINNELNRQAQQLKPRPSGMSAIEWDEITHNAKEWFSMRAESPEDLLDTSRPDYIALSHLTGRKIERDIEPEDMSSKLKSMYSEWTADRFYSPINMDSYEIDSALVLSRNRKGLVELNTRMETWDPLQDGYAGEVMTLHLHQIRMEQEAIEQEARAAEARVRAEYEASVADKNAVRPATIPGGPAVEQPMLFADFDEPSKSAATPNPANSTPSEEIPLDSIPGFNSSSERKPISSPNIPEPIKEPLR